MPSGNASGVAAGWSAANGLFATCVEQAVAQGCILTRSKHHRSQDVGMSAQALFCYTVTTSPRNSVFKPFLCGKNNKFSIHTAPSFVSTVASAVPFCQLRSGLTPFTAK